jgi:hypothetical protein
MTGEAPDLGWDYKIIRGKNPRRGVRQVNHLLRLILAVEGGADVGAEGVRTGLSVDRGAAILQALCMPEVIDELVKRPGWTAEAYQKWLAGILKRELLARED